MGSDARDQTSKMLTKVTPLPPSTKPRRPLSVKDANARFSPTQVSSTGVHSTISESGHEHTQSIDNATLDEEKIAELAQGVPETAMQELHARILLTDSRSDEEESTTEEEMALNQFSAADALATELRTAADEDLEEETAILFDDADRELENGCAAGSEMFIERYARYNVVNSYYLGRYCQRNLSSHIPEDIVDTYCMIGGSRDPPQPFIHHCKKTDNCPFESFEKDATKSHEISCTKLRVEQLLAGIDNNREFECPYDGCKFVPAGTSQRPAQLLEQHVKDIHGHETRACEHGCEPNKVYYSASTYRHHLDHAHSERWPAHCTFPDCSQSDTFAVHSALKYHLRVEHNLEDKDMVPYIPPLPAKSKWIPPTCFIDGCNSFFNSRGAQTQYLREKHGFSKENAPTDIDARAQFIVVVPKPVIGRKRAPRISSTLDVPRSKKTKA